MKTETLFDSEIRKVRKLQGWRSMVALRAAVNPSELEKLIEARDERVMSAVLSMTGKGGAIRAVDISSKRFIEKILRAAAWDKRMYAVFGPTGCGKTFAIKSAIEQLADEVAYVRVNEYNRSNRGALMSDIAKALKIQITAASWIRGSKIYGRLKEQFETKSRVVILDETQKIKDHTFEMVRDLYDETQLSLVLVGSMSFQEQLKTKKIGDEIFGQFLRRIDDRYELPHASANDVKLFLIAYGIQIDNAEAKSIAKKISTWGDIDTLSKAMRFIAGDITEGELTWTKVGAGNIIDAVERVIMLMDINYQEQTDGSNH